MVFNHIHIYTYFSLYTYTHIIITIFSHRFTTKLFPFVDYMRQYPLFSGQIFESKYKKCFLLQTDSSVATERHVCGDSMSNVYTSKPNIKLKQETLLPHFQKVKDSNLCPQTAHSDIFHSFPQPLQTKSELVPQKIRPQLLPSTHFPVQHSCPLMLLQSSY